MWFPKHFLAESYVLLLSQVCTWREENREVPSAQGHGKCNPSNWLSIIKVFDALNHLDDKIALK